MNATDLIRDLNLAQWLTYFAGFTLLAASLVALARNEKAISLGNLFRLKYAHF